jgi:hypothetical protein
MIDRRKFLQGTAALFCAPSIVTTVMKLHVPEQRIVTAAEVLEEYRMTMASRYPMDDLVMEVYYAEFQEGLQQSRTFTRETIRITL